MNTHTHHPAARPQGAARAARRSAALARFNAAFFDLMDGYMHWKYAPLKSRLFGELPPVVVEIGPGAGANMRYLPLGTTLIAAEPNPHMHARLADRARRHGIDLRLLDGACAQRLPLPSASVGAVICSLVLCSVEDPEAAVREVLRVLTPGGRFVCIEHVAAPPASVVGRLQRVLFRPWRWLFDGCHTHRDTAAVLRRAGFSRLSLEPFTWRTAFLPVRPQIAAVCVK